MTKEIIFHFLDVGDGDCTLIEFPTGRFGLIDLHTNHELGDKTIDYIKRIVGDKGIFRFILSHPHQDHLHGYKDLIDNVYVENFWHTSHEYSPQIPKKGQENFDEENKKWESYKPHWDAYEAREKKLIFTKENQDRDFLKEDNIQILSPSEELDKQAKDLGEDNDGVHRNNYVIKITNGKFSALMCGDADTAALNHLLDVDSDRIKDCTLLKAPHHGTDTHWNEDFVKLSNPKVVILHQGEERSSNSAENDYAKNDRVVGITKTHKVMVVKGKEDGNYSFVCNGDYDKVLTQLGK